MTNTVLKPVWAGFELRLDPNNFPQRVSYAAREESDEVSVTLDKRGAVVKKVLSKSGLPLSIALPARAFTGVAARAIDHGDGTVTVTLELHHTDTALCVPLLVAHDLDDIAADWRTWSELYGLPMLMVEADGVARPLDDGSIPQVTDSPTRRRRHNQIAERRPRFLVRRSTGKMGVRMKIEGREIIARR
ncbi:hypothetical protein IMCC20628_02824 [Hoeflea sp. IMCC20628]|uniref:DUF6101 family protein n=1 Tax=Hoeflea sp. IMCC20628 TaxID=1620421 RepID=UPI00063AD4EC|nr:DUF6101 family protein [Hoeflea sp. IMCC20628]AKI01519.1 hypothetical protein IMCC20628_02824 [Hoeflea sp. IMCC20628]